MSVQVRTGPSTDIWTIEATPKAGRVILYSASGSVLSVLPSTYITSRTSPLVYRYVLADKAGQVTAPYTFIVLFNPVASGKNMALLSCDVQIYGVTFSAATKNSLTLFQTASAPTGGAVDTTSIARLLSSQAAPVATVTITNPGVTLGAQIKSFAAGGQTGSAAGIYGPFDVGYRANQEDYQFIAPAGQGFLLRQAVAGTADQTYCFTLEWMEYT